MLLVTTASSDVIKKTSVIETFKPLLKIQSSMKNKTKILLPLQHPSAYFSLFSSQYLLNCPQTREVT